MALDKVRTNQLSELLRYKAWANSITFKTVAALPQGEALKFRQTRFGTIVHTLNHVWVVEDIFRHHIEGRKHSYSARNTDAPPPLDELADRVKAMDFWWIERVTGMEDSDLDEVVSFEFVGGGNGRMTRGEIILHLVNHATYHRGFVGDMLYQAGVSPRATDLPVYLRDNAPAGRAAA